MLAIPVAHLGGEDDIDTVLPMITDNVAYVIGLENYGIKEGNGADMVLLNTKDYKNSIIDIPERLLIIKSGQIIYKASYDVTKYYQ